MKITISLNEETGLLDIMTSGGTLSVSQTEAGALYMILRDLLGLKGRFMLWRKRKSFAKTW